MRRDADALRAHTRYGPVGRVPGYRDRIWAVTWASLRDNALIVAAETREQALMDKLWRTLFRFRVAPLPWMLSEVRHEGDGSRWSRVAEAVRYAFDNERASPGSTSWQGNFSRAYVDRSLEYVIYGLVLTVDPQTVERHFDRVQGAIMALSDEFGRIDNRLSAAVPSKLPVPGSPEALRRVWNKWSFSFEDARRHLGGFRRWRAKEWRQQVRATLAQQLRPVELTGDARRLWKQLLDGMVELIADDRRGRAWVERGDLVVGARVLELWRDLMGAMPSEWIRDGELVYGLWRYHLYRVAVTRRNRGSDWDEAVNRLWSQLASLTGASRRTLEMAQPTAIEAISAMLRMPAAVRVQMAKRDLLPSS